MLQLVNTKCDALLQMYQSGELRTDMKDTIRESSLITVSPAELKGKKPLAVQFARGEWIETPTWRKVAQKILQACNEQPDIHERFKSSRTLEDDPWKFTGRNGCTDKGG